MSNRHYNPPDTYCGEKPLPPSPTSAAPGSTAKVDVMVWRYANGYALHHPQDVRQCRRALGQRAARSGDRVVRVLRCSATLR